MCFDSAYPDISRIAEKNMTVYKCMILRKRNKELRSPYQRSNIYNMNELYIAPVCSIKNEAGFYSFKTFNSAKRWMNRLLLNIRSIDRKKYKIFKCTIPKGTRYLEGTFNLTINRNRSYNAISFRSKKIIFKKLMENK